MSKKGMPVEVYVAYSEDGYLQVSEDLDELLENDGQQTVVGLYKLHSSQPWKLVPQPVGGHK